MQEQNNIVISLLSNHNNYITAIEYLRDSHFPIFSCYILPFNVVISPCKKDTSPKRVIRCFPLLYSTSVTETLGTHGISSIADSGRFCQWHCIARKKPAWVASKTVCPGCTPTIFSISAIPRC